MNQVLNLMGYGSGTPEASEKSQIPAQQTNDSQKENLAPEREAASLRRAISIFVERAYVRVRSIAAAKTRPSPTTNKRATASQKSGS